MSWYSEPKTITAYAAFLGSIAAIIVSITALYEKPDDSAAHNVYKTLVLAIERLSDESEQNRADLVRLRKYVEVYNKSVVDAIDKDMSIPVDSIVPPIIAPPSPVVEIVPSLKRPKTGGSISYPIDLDTPSIPDASISFDAGISITSVDSANISSDFSDHNNSSTDSTKKEPPVKLNREWVSE